jgi:predicted N-acetyltransferase YhbS
VFADLSPRSGNALTRRSIELAEKMRDEVGSVGLVGDAKPGAVDYYERLGFVAVSAVEGAARVVPLTKLLFLPLGAVPPPKPR